MCKVPTNATITEATDPIPFEKINRKQKQKPVLASPIGTVACFTSFRFARACLYRSPPRKIVRGRHAPRDPQVNVPSSNDGSCLGKPRVCCARSPSSRAKEFKHSRSKTRTEHGARTSPDLKKWGEKRNHQCSRRGIKRAASIIPYCPRKFSFAFRFLE